MTRVRTESRTILVVADISLVTEIPAKLKNAMEKTVPQNAIPKERIFFRVKNLFLAFLV